MLSKVAVMAAVLIASCSADIMINEILLEPSGDNIGQQFFELSGTPNESLDGVAFLAIDGGGVFSGDVYQAIDLTGLSLGSNGLLLMRDFATVSLLPAADPQTSVEELGFPLFGANISQTFALVSNFAGFIFDDLDFNDDGVLDLTPWDNVVDAVGIRENDGTPADEFAFGSQLGFEDFPVTGFQPDAIFRDGISGAWYASDVENPNIGGPFSIDTAQFVDINGASQSTRPFSASQITPGALNTAAIPEPAGGVAFLFLTFFIRWSRNVFLARNRV